MTVRIGLVGAGFVAGRHANAVTQIDDVVVAGIADPGPSGSRHPAD